MRGPYGLEVSESCQSCAFRRDGFFCKSTADELKSFDAIKQVLTYPGEATLFMEEQKSQGIYLLCEGRIKLSFTSSEGRTLVLRIARPGEVLGLLSTLTGNPYKLTATTQQPCQVAFVSSNDFMKFLRKHPGIFQSVARQLGRQYESACEQLRTVGLGASVFERMGKFLLNWSAERAAVKDGARFTVPLSHEEIAEYIGSTRESVTRAMGDFRSLGLIETNGTTFAIVDRAALQECRLRPASPLEAERPVPRVTPIRLGRSRGIQRPTWKRVVNGAKSA